MLNREPADTLVGIAFSPCLVPGESSSAMGYHPSQGCIWEQGSILFPHVGGKNTRKGYCVKTGHVWGLIPSVLCRNVGLPSPSRNLKEDIS